MKIQTVTRSIIVDLSDISKFLSETYDYSIQISFEVARNEHDEIFLVLDSLRMFIAIGEIVIASLDQATLANVLRLCNDYIDKNICELDCDLKVKQTKEVV